jgi:hypothetical protein
MAIVSQLARPFPHPRSTAMYGRRLRVRGGLEQLTVLQAHVLIKCETLSTACLMDGLGPRLIRFGLDSEHPWLGLGRTGWI